MSSLLAAALPLGAQAAVQPIDGTGVLKDQNPALPTYAGAVLTSGGDTYNIGGNWTINQTALLASEAQALLTDDVTGIFNINTNIDMSVNAGKTITGFISFDRHTAAPDSPFTGTINAAGKTIKVFNTNTQVNNPGTVDNNAIGLGFFGFNTSTSLVDGVADLGAAKITVDALDVSSTNGNAFGLFANNVGANANVVINDVNVSAGLDATGYNIQGSVDAAATMTNKSITVASAGGIGHAYVVSGDVAGKVTLGDIDASGHNNNDGNAAIGVEVAGNITGTVKTGDITATAVSNGTTPAGNVYGVTVGGNLASAANNSVTFGDITADAAAGTGNAIGIAVGGNTAGTLTVGDIDVKSNTNAIGVSATGTVNDAYTLVNKVPTRQLTFGEINANSAGVNGVGGTAVGIQAAGLATNLTVSKNISAEATGTGAAAVGIQLNAAGNNSVIVGDASGKEVTIKGVAENTNANSYGLQSAGTATVTVVGKTNILGNHRMGDQTVGGTSHLGIYSVGNANINLTDGAHLVTNGIGTAGAALTINTVDSDLTKPNSASARYDIGAVYGTTTVTVLNQGNVASSNPGVDANSSTTVSVNLANSGQALAQIGDRVNVEVYGDVADVVQNPTAAAPWTVGTTAIDVNYIGNDGLANTTSTYKNLSVFTDWVLVADGGIGGNKNGSTGDIVYNGIRSRAYMNDGFLAAMMMHQRSAVFNAARDHMISFGGNRGYRGQECDPCAPVSECDPCEPICDTNPCDPCDPCGTFSGILGGKSRRFGGFDGINGGASTRNAWVNYIGRADTYQSSYNGNDWEIGMDGVQVGVDLLKNSRTQFGLIFGYEGGNAYNSAAGYVERDRIQADDVYIGMYGARILNNGADVRFALSYGWQDYTMSRYSVVVPPQPRTLFVSNFDGNTLEANLELGKRVHSGYWSMRPVLAVDILSNELDAAQEKAGIAGMDGPLAYGKGHLTQVFFRSGSDLRFHKNRFTFNSGLYLAYDMHNGQNMDTSVTRVNQPILSTRLAGSELGRSLLTFNVGGAYQLCDNLSVFGGYQGESLLGGDADTYQSVGHVGGAWRW